jgi:hypothetical protein
VNAVTSVFGPLSQRLLARSLFECLNEPRDFHAQAVNQVIILLGQCESEAGNALDGDNHGLFQDMRPW